MSTYTQIIQAIDSKPVLRFAKDTMQVLGGSLLLATAAQMAIPMWPVPLTMQTLAVMFLGLTLGKVKGTLSVILYMIEAMMGLPVLTGGAPVAAAMMLRGGYLFGFAVQAYFTGLLFEKFSKISYPIMFTLLTLVSILQLSLGALWLGSMVGFQTAFMTGFYLFIPGEIVKCLTILAFAKK
jgi:biotin transport system substrate-specific component